MTEPGTASLPTPHAGTARTWLWLGAIILLGLNLRPFLAATGTIAANIRMDTGLGFQGMAWLTLVPMALMGAGAFVAPALQVRIGARNALLGALAMLALGCALRLTPSAGYLLILTAALCGAGVAVVQAVLPGLIKRQFPETVAPVMGLYSAALLAGGALGGQLTPMVQSATESWRMALAAWALPALFACLAAAAILPRELKHRVNSTGIPAVTLLGRPRTWLLIICFGLGNGGYASLIAWLAPYYQSRGWTAFDSGSLIAWMSVAQALAALIIPALAARGRDRRPWIWLTLALQATGFAAFAFAPDLAPRAWVVAMGAGLGGYFALTLIVALDHFPDPRKAGALSAMMQGGGFILASTGPWVAAGLRDLSGTFTTAWILHVCEIVLVAMLVQRLCPTRYGVAVGDTS